mmetsp:Transcript_3911/g.13411  ORF Transcript_3911/g.13411 Transcript_3911/m.13411 type:complete len:85 (-) Transcript_3911:612-866(-)
MGLRGVAGKVNSPYLLRWLSVPSPPRAPAQSRLARGVGEEGHGPAPLPLVRRPLEPLLHGTRAVQRQGVQRSVGPHGVEDDGAP